MSSGGIRPTSARHRPLGSRGSGATRAGARLSIAHLAKGDLFEKRVEKAGNVEVVEAFCKRLVDVAGFKNVPKPIPMRNDQGRTIYYLIFASQKGVANQIVRQIFEKYETRGA